MPFRTEKEKEAWRNSELTRLAEYLCNDIVFNFQFEVRINMTDEESKLVQIEGLKMAVEQIRSESFEDQRDIDRAARKIVELEGEIKKIEEVLSKINLAKEEKEKDIYCHCEQDNNTEWLSLGFFEDVSTKDGGLTSFSLYKCKCGGIVTYEKENWNLLTEEKKQEILSGVKI